MSVPTVALAAILSTQSAGATGDPSTIPETVVQDVATPEPGAAATPAALTEPAASVEPDASAELAASGPLAPAPPESASQVPPADADSAPAAAVNDKSAQGAGDESTHGKEATKDIVVEGELGPPPGDPLQGVNEQTFEVVQAVDKAVVEPVAHGYMKIVPKPVRDGVHNVVTNLDEPIVFLSFILELKPVSALTTVGRFAINSTLGLAGLFDVAKKKPFNEPHRANGLGYVMGYYGVKPGPFLYLPLIGSTTVRDLIGRLAELPILPTVVGKPFNNPAYVLPKATLSAIDDRAQDDARLQKIHKESSNPYAAYRSYYLRKRQAEIDVLKGRRDNADVPVFDDVPPDLPDSATPDDGGATAPSKSTAPADHKLSFDKSALLAE